jgi:hypothetical protein
LRIADLGLRIERLRIAEFPRAKRGEIRNPLAIADCGFGIAD